MVMPNLSLNRTGNPMFSQRNSLGTAAHRHFARPVNSSFSETASPRIAALTAPRLEPVDPDPGCSHIQSVGDTCYDPETSTAAHGKIIRAMILREGVRNESRSD